MSKEEIFWNWFKENNSNYYYLNQMTDPAEKEKLLDVFLKELHIYCDKLFFEIGGYPNEPQDLIITAEGNKDYFMAVEQLVSSAPNLPDWSIIAHKPPMGIDFVTEYKNIKLNPAEMWFLPLENESEPNLLGLRISLPNYDAKEKDAFLAGCYQVLDTMLGEKSATQDINYVEVTKTPKHPEKAGLIELDNLPEYIAWRKRN